MLRQQSQSYKPTLYHHETTLPPSGNKVIVSRYPIFSILVPCLFFKACSQFTVLYLLVYLLDHYSYLHRPNAQLGPGSCLFGSPLNIQYLAECPAPSNHWINFGLMCEYIIHKQMLCRNASHCLMKMGGFGHFSISGNLLKSRYGISRDLRPVAIISVTGEL